MCFFIKFHCGWSINVCCIIKMLLGCDDILCRYQLWFINSQEHQCDTAMFIYRHFCDVFMQHYFFSPGFEVYSLVSGLLGGLLWHGPVCAHYRWHWRTGKRQLEKNKGRERDRRRVSVRALSCLCVLFQVSALYFTSANICLFERHGVRTGTDSADIILWDELVKGKHRSCYTLNHRGHTPAWARKGRNTHTHTGLPWVNSVS